MSTLGLLPIEEALAIVLAHAPRLPVESVALGLSAGRVLASPLLADRDQPPFDRAAMDGVALRAADTANPLQGLSILGQAAAGAPLGRPLPVGACCVRIFTGGVVPVGADAVVMVEQVRFAEGLAFVAEPASVGQHIARQGCEVRAGGAVVPAGVRLTAAHLGVAAAFGHAQLPVSRRPRVAILPTGDEIVAVDQAPGPGQIRDSNRYQLAQLCEAAGAEVIHLPVARDTPEALRAGLQAALAAADVVVTCGGVSAGDLDLVAPVLQALGATCHFHKIRIKPGKPLLFATLGEKIVLGLPGNPVSAAVCATLFGQPLLAAMQGGHAGWRLATLPLCAPLGKTGPRDEIVPLQFAELAGQLAVLPVALAGSADVFAFSRAELLGWRAPHQAAMQLGEPIRAFLAPRPG